MNYKNIVIVFGLIVSLIIFAISSLFFGYTDGITFSTLVDVVHNYNSNNNTELILLTQRIPRVINAIIVGSSLAMCGFLAQSITKNPFASPSILGINSTAIFVVLLSIVIAPNVSNRFIFALIGSCCGLLLTIAITRLISHNYSITIMVIVGMAINILFGSVTQLIILLNAQIGDVLSIWMIGSLEGKYLDILKLYYPIYFISIIIIILYLPKLQILVLDDTKAKSLGINVKNVKIVVSLVISALSALAISIAGPIAMIALVSPHLARPLASGKIYLWLLYSALLGAILLMLSDVLARIVIAPNELSVGILTNILAAIFFFILAIKEDNVRSS